MAVTERALAELLVTEATAIADVVEARQRVAAAQDAERNARQRARKASAEREQAEVGASPEVLHSARNLFYTLLGAEAYQRGGSRRIS